MCDEIIWGVEGPIDDPTQAPRRVDDHRALDPDPTEPQGGGWYLYELDAGLVKGHEHFEGDPAAFWFGFPVDVSTCTMVEFNEQDGGYGADRAQERWHAFRERCVREAGHDPGPGEILVVHDNGRRHHHRPDATPPRIQHAELARIDLPNRYWGMETVDPERPGVCVQVPLPEGKPVLHALLDWLASPPGGGWSCLSVYTADGVLCCMLRRTVKGGAS